MLSRLRDSLRTERTQLGILFMIGAVLRAAWIDRTPFWYDEAFTSVIVQLPVAQLLTATAGDVHPPLYYLLLKLWGMVAGYTPFGLRQFSAICAVVALWQVEQLTVVYNLERRVKLTVMALAAFSPVMIYYAGEARMYALLTVLVLGAWLAILRRQWALASLATLAMLYTHNYGLVYGACLGLVAVGRAVIQPRERYEAGKDHEWSGTDLPQVLLAMGLPVLLYLPWFGFGLWSQFGKMTTASHWLNHVSVWGQILGTTSLLMASKAPSGINVLLSALVVGLTPPVLWSTLKAKRLDWLVMALGPLALAAGISLFRVIYLTRALQVVLPAVYLIIGSALWKTRREYLFYPAAAGLCIAAGLLAVLAASYNGTAKYNPLTQQDLANIRPGVPVVHIGDFTAINWIASRPDTANYIYLSSCPALPGELEPRTREAMGVRTMAPYELPAEYYLVSYVGNLSNKCQEDQFKKMTRGLQAIQINQLEYGQSGIYYHARR